MLGWSFHLRWKRGLSVVFSANLPRIAASSTLRNLLLRLADHYHLACARTRLYHKITAYTFDLVIPDFTGLHLILGLA